MLSNRKIKFLAVATLIVVVIFATISVVNLPASENTLNSSQDAGLVADFDSENSPLHRQPDPFNALNHNGPGR